MKIAIARGPGEFGGIFRRFRELVSFARGRHDAVGVLPLATSDGTLSDPVRTLTYDRRHISWRIARADARDAVLDACAPMIARIAADLRRERPDGVLASDTDLKGLVVVAAARDCGIPVTTFVAGLASVEARFAHSRPPGYVAVAERYCLEVSDGLIFPSRTAAEAAGRDAALAPWQVVYNGVNDAFRTVAPPDPGRSADRVAGAIMRFSPVKNPAAFGRVAASLAARGIGAEVVCDVSRHPDAAAVFAPARVLPPTLDSAALAERVAGWRCVVSPSQFEASGNVPMEALAAGTPAVVTRAMGIAELFPEFGLADHVVDVDDTATMAALARAAAPIDRRLRDDIRARFAWPAVAANIFDVLEGGARARTAVS
jgi:glycosyltransferase involved in cell wall biosynthesis